MEPMNATARLDRRTSARSGPRRRTARRRSPRRPMPPACRSASATSTGWILGGGFGRRGTSQTIVRQAVLIAKAMPGTPVKLIWSREEDMLHGCYHPITMCKMIGALDEDGNLVGLHMRISGQSILATVNPAGACRTAGSGDVPGPQCRRRGRRVRLYDPEPARSTTPCATRQCPPGFWRGVNNNQNAIYLECFIDEMAHAAGRIRWRSARSCWPTAQASRGAERGRGEGRLGHARAQGRLSRPRPAHGLRQLRRRLRRGLGQTKEGKLKIHRIVAATDCGHAVNPQQIAAPGRGLVRLRSQRRCCTGRSPSRTARSSRRTSTPIPSMRMDEMPKVETIVMPSGGLLGRRRRADDLRRRAGRAERDLRGDRQAHPQPADRQPGSAQGLTIGCSDQPSRRPRRRRGRFHVPHSDALPRVLVAAGCHGRVAASCSLARATPRPVAASPPAAPRVPRLPRGRGPALRA